MLQALGLSYEPSPLVGKLFHNLNLSLSEGEKVALVGRNGCGKTKLIQILAGLLRADEGRVVFERGASVGYLPQEFDWSFSGTLEEFLFGDLVSELAGAIARQAGMMGFVAEHFARPFQSFSNGEQMRAAIARLLASEPALLLLDEPTNHLDIEAREWLQFFLKSCPQAVLMVCHDRAVVDAVVGRVLELDRGILKSWAGGYSDMQRQKLSEHQRDTEIYLDQKAEERRLKNMAEEFRQKAGKIQKKPKYGYNPMAKPVFAAKAAKADRQAKAVLKRIEHAIPDRIEKPFLADDLALTFPNFVPLRSDPVVRVRGLNHCFGDRKLFGGLNLDLPVGGRVGIVGANGCGKTTLFRILLGEVMPACGMVEITTGVRWGYLSQGRGLLPRQASIIEALEAERGEEEHFARTLLARLGMRNSAIEKPVEVLSVGERTKVELVRILLAPANVLILDEPGNHLEVEALEVLEEALAQYPGSVLFTSHDRMFLERVATEVLCL